jgi:hypothetical protein
MQKMGVGNAKTSLAIAKRIRRQPENRIFVNYLHDSVIGFGITERHFLSLFRIPRSA